ncbi:GUN4 domain-containing protein [Planktothrix sp. FACHB-1355]|uniref:GUN4 domain-containing protein n=1 Tax=Aerosakkonema funiforme FACHB-1375 TaxID=2949571 RepID=A0A926ZL41_9CYAN|nr:MULTISPECIES: GUN4 domain-containing protein [Oscillatoriales]MBD2186007.1 GUN4 domain-containing protein [Aerosakkonema funiforme FACHB-1375]MBD3559225.1 GUN4 domain-containing protein [Planktothrix sp. FACHB-1355]
MISNLNPDYTKLRDLLANKKWKEADLETRTLMLSIAGADKRKDCLLTQDDMKKFPCAELRKIDRLWIHYSQGRFGFSIINKIYNEVNKDYHQLAERVGWRNGEKWIGYNEITFTDDVPVGHLPITWLVPTSFWMYWLARFASAGWRLLLERASNCQIE